MLECYEQCAKSWLKTRWSKYPSGLVSHVVLVVPVVLGVLGVPGVQVFLHPLTLSCAARPHLLQVSNQSAEIIYSVSIILALSGLV